MAVSLQQHGREVADLWRQVRAIAREDDEAVVDTIDGETDAIEALRHTIRLAIEAEQHAEACKALRVTYMERQKLLEGRAERYRMAAAAFLQEVGEKSIRLPEATISWRAAGPQLVGDCPAVADLPESCVRYVRTKHEPSIKEALARGEHIPGLSLSNGGVALTVRRA